MPGPFDTTTKYLVQTYPRDWLALIGLESGGPVDLLDADLATVNPLADKVIRLSQPVPRIVHLEFQSTYDPTMGQRLAEYHLLLAGRHHLPVRSVLMLLRRQADGPRLSGRHDLGAPGEAPDLSFRYGITRLWQQPVDALLGGPLGTLPLADVAPADLPQVVRSLERRLDAEATPTEAQALEVVTFALLGLRYPPELARQLLPGIRNMRESSTYQMILDEGRAEGEARGRADEARELLVQLGTQQFGAPDAQTSATLEGLREHALLRGLIQRLFRVSGWDELLTGQ